MRPETPEHPGPLRQGLSTGVCATAGALAAARSLLGAVPDHQVIVTLPRGQRPTMTIADLSCAGEAATAGVIKDAGDDPDATHGARLWVTVTPTGRKGVTFAAGEGVGTITRPGLSLDVGEPAINPTPRRMIREHLEAVARQFRHTGGFRVTVGIDDGEAIAQRTMNPRLGIVGGLSVLGTTGIVRPFSCSAYIASIHQSVDVARANRIDHVAGCTGGTSEQFARRYFALEDAAIIEMGDMFGGLLKYLKQHPLPRITLASGFGKLSKFAAGHADTHSLRCAIDFHFLAEQAAAAGAQPSLSEKIRRANTSIEALEHCRHQNVPIGDRIARLGLERAREYLPASSIRLGVYAVDRSGQPVGHAEDPL